jgi:hypothetical protein
MLRLEEGSWKRACTGNALAPYPTVQNAKAIATVPTLVISRQRRVGWRRLKCEDDRAGQFHTQACERYSRYEPHIAEGLTQMFVAGTSTRHP